MEKLQNNEILQWLLEESKKNNTENQLDEVLSWKTFDKKKVRGFLEDKINKIYNYWCKKSRSGVMPKFLVDDDSYSNPLREYLDELWSNNVNQDWDKISEEDVKKILSDLNDHLCKNAMEPLRATFDQEIPSFRADWNDKEYYLKKIEDRTLSVEEYEKMQRQIGEHGSILARSNRRWREYGRWDWDVILSSTTWKIYDVEWAGEWALEEDYKAYRYYTSRSGASAAWNIIAWKWSLIYMPTSRVDVTYPELYFRNINWLNMTMCTDRWVINEYMPTIIKSWKVNLWVDVVLLSQRDHLEQGMAKDLINTIDTKWENLKDWPIYTYRIKYYDENLELKEKIFTYKTNMDPKDINFRWRWNEFFWINRGFQVEQTWSFIDKVVWIRKYKWKYVRLWQFGLIKEVFDEHPNSDMDKQYFEDIEIWDKGEIIHTKEEIKPMFSERDTTKKFNGWIMTDNFAYKHTKRKYGDSWKLKNICSEHGVEYDETIEEDDKYYLVYEDDISTYNEILQMGWQSNVNMEFEYDVPKTIFEKYPIDYWKKFLCEKLREKALNSINIHSFPIETQKNIALNYLKSHKDTIFTLQDSYDSWNCHPWTDRFVKAFNLPEKISGKELLNHKDLWKMMTIYDFRKIFVNKALPQAFGEDSLYWGWRRRRFSRRSDE